MKSKTVTLLLCCVVILLIAGAVVPWTLDSAAHRSRHELAQVQRMVDASKQLTVAAFRVMNPAGEDDAARASWSRDLESADRLVQVAINAAATDESQVPHPDLGDLWAARRQAALDTIDAIDAHGRASIDASAGRVTVPQETVLRRLSTQLKEEQRAAAAFEAGLSKLSDSISARVEWSDRLTFWLIIANTSAFLLTAIAIPFVFRKLHRRLLADNRARKTAELAARASERDLLITLHSIGDAVIAIDPVGRIQRLNQVAEHLTGWKESAAVGRLASEVLNFVDDSSPSSVNDSVAEVLRTGAPIVRATNLELIRADGTRRQVSENAAPIRDENGDIHGVVIVLHDTTIQRALEARLRDVQRMESIGRLAGGVAHEFNNLLQIIVGNTALLRSLLPPRGESPDYFERIDHAVQRAAALTNQLLAFGGRQTLVLRSSDLRTLIERSIEVARQILPDEIEIEYKKPLVPAMARIDAGQIEQVVVNLCLHARDAMPHGGAIRIVLDEIEIGGTSDHAALPPRIGPYLRLRVSDTGAGLTDEERRRVFEPFFSSSGSVLDAGLGLAAVHGIVQQHGGFVEVESVAGKGTTFTVLIPGRNAPLLPRKASHSPRVPSLRGRILVAEDEPGVRLMVERILERHGFEPVSAADGAEACRIFEANSSDISLALLDVIMPQIGGVEVGRLIRESNPNLPIIFCTGYSDGVLGELKLAKPWKVLHKPYNVGELIDTINRCLAGVEVATPT